APRYRRRAALEQLRARDRARASRAGNDRPRAATRVAMRVALAFACIACSSSAPHEPAPVPRHGEPGDARAAPAATCPTAFGSTDACTPAEPRRVVVRQRTDFGQGPGPIED